MSEEPAEEEPMPVPVEPEPQMGLMSKENAMTFFMGLAEAYLNLLTLAYDKI